MKRRNPDRTDEDRELWHQVMRKVTPLLGKRATASPPPPPSPRDLPVRPHAPKTAIAGRAPLPSLQTGTASGIDAATLHRFRAGKMPVEATLDLHGCTQTTAHRALSRFVLGSYHRGHRCVLVITGKGPPGHTEGHEEGRGVLRRALLLWLDDPELRPCVLATAPAKPRHGGDGARYLLLRRQRPA